MSIGSGNAVEQVVRKRQKIFRLPLWLLLLAFIPLSFAAKTIGDVPDVVYSERKSDILASEDCWIDFEHDKYVTRFKRFEIVDEAFTSRGLNFSVGLPKRSPDMELADPIYEPEIRFPKQAPELTRGDQVWKRKRIPTPISAPDDPLRAGVRILGQRSDCAIMPFSIQNAFGRPIFSSVYDSMTIDFTKSNKNMEIHRVGFVAPLRNPSSFEIRCYSPEGEFLSKQRNIGTGKVFMGLKSKKEIGWIEVQSSRGCLLQIRDLGFGE